MHIFDKTVTSHSLRITANLNDDKTWGIYLSNGFSQLFMSNLDIHKFPEQTVKQLKTTGIILSEYQLNIRKRMILELEVPMPLVMNLMAMWVISDGHKDYRDDSIFTLKRDYIPVEAHGYDNLFLVVDIDLTDCSVLAIELDQKNMNVYGMVALQIKQLTKSKWKGKHDCKHNLKNFLEENQ